MDIGKLTVEHEEVIEQSSAPPRVASSYPTWSRTLPPVAHHQLPSVATKSMHQPTEPTTRNVFSLPVPNGMIPQSISRQSPGRLATPRMDPYPHFHKSPITDTSRLNSPQDEFSYDHQSENSFAQKNHIREKLPQEVTRALLQWLIEHAANPYPNDQEKQEMLDKFKITPSQLNNWFINARRRVLRKLLRSGAAVGMTPEEAMAQAERLTRRGRRPKEEYFGTSFASPTSKPVHGLSASDMVPNVQRRAVPSTPAETIPQSNSSNGLDMLASLANANP